MTLSTGPDMRYGCDMSNGKRLTGTLRRVAANAALATHRYSHHVLAWTAPGRNQVVVRQRIGILVQTYFKELERLAGRA
jgi:hypothetical protein